MSKHRIYLNYLEQIHKDTISKSINESARMLDLRSDFTISFLPKGKLPTYTEDEKWSRKDRQTGKPTRIIKRLLNTKEFNDRDFELFNNQLKAEIENIGTFSVVSGEDIRF